MGLSSYKSKKGRPTFAYYQSQVSVIRVVIKRLYVDSTDEPEVVDLSGELTVMASIGHSGGSWPVT